MNRGKPAASKPNLRRPAKEAPSTRARTQLKRKAPEGDLNSIERDKVKVGLVSRFAGFYQGRPSEFVSEIQSKKEDLSHRWLDCQVRGSPDLALQEWVRRNRLPSVNPVLQLHVCAPARVPEVGIEDMFHGKEWPPAQDLDCKGNLLEVFRPRSSMSRVVRLGSGHGIRGVRLREERDRGREEDKKERARILRKRRRREGEKRGRRKKRRKQVKDMVNKSRWDWKGSSLDPAFKPPRIRLGKKRHSSASEGTAS